MVQIIPINAYPGSMTTVSAVTGALGYTGKSLTMLLLERGERVRTLTNSPHRPNPFGDELEIMPLAFDDPTK